ncbi:kinetochore Sim4 complex subunit FTA2-domain-containing protein [Achaetomium macrosporum]|uniref:Kinetochore Sim4 complex subunit FTA2-domain-containing protein n=1 Tax=Achaetomium macrosporum TaxID=79813 RepID=A0AAN7CGE3_9PEZI|nr:kinetochore Sim4 complex subunit FTA2-domain-containing protein [Achaetomium macrosporum]
MESGTCTLVKISTRALVTYTDWPQSAADFVPLPCCDDPKLKHFDFKGPRKIEFVDHLGESLHAHVFQVQILGRVYALKLFRFVEDDDWLGPDGNEQDDLEVLSAFYHYSEPFSAECRAFGRLQEAGNEELAVQCFGYLLLDEQHERALMERFNHLGLDFNGNGDYPGHYPGDYDLRSRFLGRDGRPPPLRGIVKALGQTKEPLRARGSRRILRDVIRLHQPGIIDIGVAHRQLVDGRPANFSTVITTPPFLTNPELNPSLAPEWIAAREFETFQFSINDYWAFDIMDKLTVRAFPSGRGCRIDYGLRSTPSRDRVDSLVDPRRYHWRASATGPRKPNGRRRGRPSGPVLKTSRLLDARPPRWYYDCDIEVAAELKNSVTFSTSLSWEFKDGLIFPRKKG